MTRKNESVTLSLSAEEKAELEAIALSLGCTWGDKPNLSELMRAIAQCKFKILPSESPDAIYLQNLKGAIGETERSLRKLKKLL